MSSGAELPTIAQLRNPHCGEKPAIAQLGIHNPQFHMLWRTYNLAQQATTQLIDWRDTFV